MTATVIDRTPIVTIELDERTPAPAAHRLSELVQALTGCTLEGAELAVSDPTPEGPVPPDRALDVLAAALVRLRGRATG